MRTIEQNKNISVHAIAGTHVVILGLNASDKARQGLPGFTIERINHTEDNEHRYLSIL